ncbi:MAG: isoprenyl transferase [Phycisphaerales bacterium]|nr:isoprenyl transferase [Phycisphaerales bacterium]
MSKLLEQIDKDKIPVHVAIIMDGNGRWAKKQQKDRLFGHNRGAQSVMHVVEASADLGVGYLTLYAFSTENWGRPQSEIKGLMSLLGKFLKSEAQKLYKNNIRLHTIGDIGTLPLPLQKAIQDVKKKTECNTRLHLIIALSYGSRAEIVQATKLIANEVKQGHLDMAQIDESLFAQYLETADFPDPDLLIRTSGEQRVSNFLLYQISYSELYFTNIEWPDFSKDDYYRALISFQTRKRTCGKI